MEYFLKEKHMQEVSGVTKKKDAKEEASTSCSTTIKANPMKCYP